MVEGQLADIAKVRPVSFDFSNRPFSYAEPLLPHVTVATFSASGASDDEVHEILDRACGQGVSTVIVTRGSAGAVVSDGATVAGRAPSRTDVVDTLGAGDAFIASALVALLKGASLEQVAETATAYAALTCQYFGAFGHEAPDSAGPSRAGAGDPFANHTRT
jgi:fructoselysine 6-kinase